MKHKLISVIFILALLLGPLSSGHAIPLAQAAGSICFVDGTAIGANDGSTWADAFTDLQIALAATGCTEIHVAAGTYYPATGRDPMATFQLLNNVVILGGYPNGGGDLPDPAVYVTTLDGNSDLSGDSNYFSYHVVTGDGTNSSAVLDGFTITNGSAWGDMPMRGGGIYIDTGSPTLRNLVISGNATNGGGGGIYLFDSSPTLTNIIITGNGGPSGSLKGAGLWSDGDSSPVLTQVRFDSNTGDFGGGMYSSGGNPTLTNVTFISNQAFDTGGGLYIEGGSLSLSGCQFDSNSAIDGAGIYMYGVYLDMQNTTIQNGIAGGYGGGIYISSSSSAIIRGSKIDNNLAYLQGGGLYVEGILGMTGGSVSQNDGQSGGGGLALVGSLSAELANVVLNGNQASYGGQGGAILSDSSTALFSNLLISNSFSNQGGGMALISSDIGIVNATFVRNDSTWPGTAIFSDNLLTIANSIVWEHVGGASINSATTITNSLLQDGCPAGATCTGLVSSDPQFANSQMSDFRLTANSPAVDAGDVTLLPADTYDLDGDGNLTERISLDLRGKPRVAISGVDIGAYEVQVGNINWTEAVNMPLTLVQPDVYANSLDRYLDRQGQSQWFKFTIQPDSKVVVTLTGLAANYDLTLYEDITQAFDELNSSQDLVQLSAEFAPDTFSPDTFSPDTFSPDTFSPDTFSPDTFSPDTFSPDTFSPDTFSPDTYSPDTFSPDTFSPDTFSPDTFSPDTFSPDTFSPDTFSPDTFSPDTFSPDTFSSAQTRSLIAVSAHDGTQGEGIIVNTWTKSGDFYLRVRGRNGVFNADSPFHLEVTLLSGTCGSVNPILPASNTLLQAGDYRALILTNLNQTEGTTAEKTLLQTNLATLASRTDGWVVDVGADAQVSAASLQAQDNPSCVYAMNLQAEAIKDIVDGFRELNPDLEYIVLVGNDHAIPFFRYADNSLLASEIDYSPPVLDDTTSQASLKSGYILSQDAYGAAVQVSYKAGTLPIPELAVGRLVETASDINHMLDAYLGTAAGIIYPSRALVTGYDFLEDSAIAVRDELQASLGATAVDTLIMDSALSPQDPSAWTADDLRLSLFDSHHDVLFLAGHFSASSTLAADYKTRLQASEVLASSTDFINSLVYSTGCHSGYNIVNEDGVPGVTGEPDWAQVFAAKGATFIGGTGYQYGDTEFIEYSERLYLEFTRQLRYGSGPVAVGKALVQAKLAYLANTPLMRGIHEKSVLQATLFGLPMMQFDLAGRIPAPVDVPLVTGTTEFTTDPGYTLGLNYADLNVTPTFTDHTVELDQALGGGRTTTVSAFYLEGQDGVVVNPSEPVLPLEMLNVTSPDEGFVLRGVGWRGGDYTDLPGLLPLTGAATEDLRAPHTPFFSDVFYPLRPWNINYFDALGSSGGSTRLALMPAQYRSTEPGSLTGFLRRFDSMDFRLYYSSNIGTYTNMDKNWNNTPALSAPPDISRVSSFVNPDGTLSFEITVTGDPAAGIQEAWIVYTFESGGRSGTWRPLDLEQDTDDTRLWKGTLDLDGVSSSGLRFIVQAVNGVGLVTMMTNEGRYYQPGVDPAAQPQGQLPITLTLEIPALHGSYGGQQAFSAFLSRDGAPLAGLPVTFTLGGMGRLAVTGDDGRAIVNFFLAVMPDEYTLVATFDGNDVYAPANASSLFTIEPGTSLVVLEPAVQYVAPGANTQFIATVTSAGLPQAGKSVALTLDLGGVTQYTSVAVTDYAGQATFQVPGQPIGSYTLKAWFGLPVTEDLDLSSPYYLGSFDTALLSSGYFPPPGLFGKISPVNGSSSAQPASLALSWGGSSGAVWFEYCYDTSDDDACSSWISTGATTSANISGLSTSTAYFWQVRANNANGTTYADGGSTAYWSFTTSPGQIFGDVLTSYWAASWVERLYKAGITNGCSANPLKYCPEDPVTRTQMAIFLERGLRGSTYTPPAATGTVFVDVLTSTWAASWIEKLYADGITNGCSLSPLAYCPDSPVTRAQMAAFLLRARYGHDYVPPSVGLSTGFNDVPVSLWAAAWIKQLAVEGITSGCGGGNYCPDDPVTRAEMAKFLVTTFNLP